MWLEVTCTKCGESLAIGLNGFGMVVQPCKGCQKVAYDDGVKSGIEEAVVKFKEFKDKLREVLSVLD